MFFEVFTIASRLVSLVILQDSDLSYIVGICDRHLGRIGLCANIQHLVQTVKTTKAQLVMGSTKHSGKKQILNLR